MDDISKLEHLLTHWIEHNQSHEEGYQKWIERAEEAGLAEVAQEIKKAMELSHEMNSCFQKAGELLKGK